jgi:hypothetical protein
VTGTFDLQHTTELLARTPEVLRAWLADLPEEWTRTNEGADTWSPFDVVGHLIHGEEADWIPRARQILRGDGDKPFTPFDRFAHLEANRTRKLEELLEDFEAARRRSLEELAGFGLTPGDFEAQGTHPEFGTVNLRQLLATWLAHDLTHLAQIARVMAKRYGTEVGPWEKYLSVLHH